MTMVCEQDELLVLKEGIYSYLSSVFNLAPDEKLLNIMSNNEVREVFEQISSEAVKFLTENHNPEEVRLDFNSLFMVPGDRYVTPYESVYVDEPPVDGSRGNKRLLMGPSAVEVQKFYTRAGFKLSDRNKELPDYAGVELQFVADLIKEERSKRENGNQEEALILERLRKEFIKNHLGRWFVPLCDEIIKKAATNFYKGIGIFTKAVILQEINN